MRAERPEADDLGDAVEVFDSVRPRLFGIAYRMLGSAAEAEDVVQDAWVRWQTTDRSAVLDATAFLSTVTTRLAINVATSARMRRETYVGPWLPEPVDTGADPAVGAERGEALDFAVLLLLETLKPTERAAYVLREAFDYSYREIAAVIGSSEANARQLARRARTYIAGERRSHVGADEHRRLLDNFITAARTGDLAALEALLASDAASYSDGGGVRGASRIPVLGKSRVARYIVAFQPRFWPGTRTRWVEANGRTCALITRGTHAIALLSVDAGADGITRLLWVLNPSKLNGFSALA
ncbi:RNA polymerase sigma-70 factor [Streptomyces sp. NPDC093228]|uniref:RNA polymerase sigma-70 factor n=1 Tax=unclassified Streptomyces TaxID=2593676 RepID=UPI0029B4B41F|nr:RNA polymerase sigma-70 factor [Streptomyces sp. MI02-2A]MDX3262127.1 RNA polymerase sigma-70 factor [Streptomyces sp. MI02-2A]